MSKNISLLTYNVFLRPPPIKTNEDDYKQQRFSEILQVIKNYDIVCLQEMFQTGTFRLQRLLQFAIQNKFYYWKMSESPSFLPGPVVDSGLLVISKFPILSSYFSSYKIGILSDSASDKGYIYCRINVHGEILHLFATHLQASYMQPGKDLQRQLSVKVRLRQSQMLIESISKHLTENNYSSKDLVLLVGDLNINSNQKPFRLTLNSHLSGYRQSKDRTNVRPLNQEFDEQQHFSEFTTFKQLFTNKRMVLIDHIFQKYKEHPPTFGDNQTILTDKTQSVSMQRLDYIFTLIPTSLSEKIQQPTLRAKTSTSVVQQFKRPLSKYGQLSDHYGISIQIEKVE